jgi:hypothetical protein
MLQRLKLLCITLLLAVSTLPVLAPAAAYAIDPLSPACSSPAAKSSPACKTTGEDPVSGKNGILIKVARILSLVAGIGAVIVLMVGAFTYVTAGSDANKAAGARKTIIAALIGLVVIALTQVFIALIINLVE